MLTEKQIIEYVKNAFVNRQLEYEYDDKFKRFSKSIEINSIYSHVTTDICVMENGIHIYATSDLALKKNIKAAAEYVARINCANSRCPFVLDCDTGEHSFGKFFSYNDLEAHIEDFDDYILSFLAYCAILYSTIGLGMLQVMFKVETPKEAARITMEKISNLDLGDDNDDDNHEKVDISAD